MSAPRSLPPQADLQHLRYQAKDLIKAHRAAFPETAHRIRQALPEWTDRSDTQVFASPFSLKDAQRAIAREYGFDQWADLKSHVESRRLSALVGNPRTRSPLGESIHSFTQGHRQAIELLRAFRDGDVQAAERVQRAFDASAHVRMVMRQFYRFDTPAIIDP